MDQHDNSQNLVLDYFNGDLEAFYVYLDKSISECMKWKHVMEDYTDILEYKEAATHLVKTFLGYLPDKKYRVGFELALRRSIKRRIDGEIDKETFDREGNIFITAIRNKEMAEHLVTHYSMQDFEDYEHMLLEYHEPALNRLIWLLGYQPNVRHSMKAELMLRQAMASDQHYFPKDDLTPFDLRIVNIVKYREIGLTNGMDEAKTSLIASYNTLREFNKKKSPKTFKDIC